MTQAEKKGFSWMGLLFGGAYYAGYGQLVKGLIMAVISFIPLTAIPVNIYAGLKAKKHLPVGAQAFEWPKAVLVFFIPMVLGGAVLFFTQGGAKAYTQADFMNDVSGYWLVDQSGIELGFDLRKQPYGLINESGRSDVTLLRYTPMDAEGYCSVHLRLATGKMIILTMNPEDPELMALSSPGMQESILKFTREL